MRFSLRFVIPLTLVLALMAFISMPLIDVLTTRWFTRDLDIRSNLITNALKNVLAEQMIRKDFKSIETFLENVTQDERLYAIGLCDAQDRFIFRTKAFPSDLSCMLEIASMHKPDERKKLHISKKTIEENENVLGHLIIVHETDFIQRRSTQTRKGILYFFLTLLILLSSLTVLIARLSFRKWTHSLRSFLSIKNLFSEDPTSNTPNELLPLAQDLRALIQDIESDRRYRDDSRMTWTSKTLKKILRDDLKGEEIIIVSNREPYIHNWNKEGKIEVQFPASGLVTALEPIMRACSGTWVAHGSGTADREVVDEKDRVQVPPDNPSYQIRRVWLSPEEEKGYYYGFSNEGLWPLCHIAHTRPKFHHSDWIHYKGVNAKFANVVIEEAKTQNPVVLVQDYHFALLPQLIRQQMPNATIITFWHIPWPNPEAFGICPWRDEILKGLLGSSILGFHTRFHCHNFIDTVDRFLETRIERETSTISFRGDLTKVQPYPISIEWPSRWLEGQKSIEECRLRIRQKFNLIEDCKIGIGVDRLDYTKGILERFFSVERLLEKNPEWIGKFSFIQIAAPSRTGIDDYQAFDIQVRKTASAINERFGKKDYKPILLMIEHHTPFEVFEYYRASDVCLISSLHDGMNLVAKEFLAARDDEKGVLILSQFTGASRELTEALIVNPYNIDQCARALALALNMPVAEQMERMRSMRELVKEFNVYRWGGRMLLDAFTLRQKQRLMERIHHL